MKKSMRILTLLLALLFAAGCFAACSDAPKTTDTVSAPVSVATDTNTATDTETDNEVSLGVTITVEIVHNDGTKKEVAITTSATNLRGALEQENLVEGDESAYGLYVKVVDGERADYDTDGAYWAFSKNGEMLMTGVDATEIADGEHYEITYTKG